MQLMHICHSNIVAYIVYLTRDFSKLKKLKKLIKIETVKFIFFSVFFFFAKYMYRKVSEMSFAVLKRVLI